MQADGRFSMGKHNNLRRTNNFEACLTGHNIGQSRLHLDNVIIDAVHLIGILDCLDITHYEKDIFIR